MDEANKSRSRTEWIQEEAISKVREGHEVPESRPHVHALGVDVEAI